jgi:hypothetical protein
MDPAIIAKQQDDWWFQEYEESVNTPEDCLKALKELKQLQNFIQENLKTVQAKLTTHYESGELDHLKDEKGSLLFQKCRFIFVAGRKLYDFSECPDVLEKEAELKELKNTARVIAKEKDGASSWRVLAVKES